MCKSRIECRRVRYLIYGWVFLVRHVGCVGHTLPALSVCQMGVERVTQSEGPSPNCTLLTITTITNYSSSSYMLFPHFQPFILSSKSTNYYKSISVLDVNIRCHVVIDIKLVIPFILKKKKIKKCVLFM